MTPLKLGLHDKSHVTVMLFTANHRTGFTDEMRMTNHMRFIVQH